jgi:hypothetical protein
MPTSTTQALGLAQAASSELEQSSQFDQFNQQFGGQVGTLAAAQTDITSNLAELTQQIRDAVQQIAQQLSELDLAVSTILGLQSDSAGGVLNKRAQRSATDFVDGLRTVTGDIVFSYNVPPDGETRRGWLLCHQTDNFEHAVSDFPDLLNVFALQGVYYGNPASQENFCLPSKTDLGWGSVPVEVRMYIRT